MYASIQRYDHILAHPDEVMPAGRQLATALYRVQGFIAYVLLAVGEGQFVAVSLFEDEAGREIAEQLPSLGEWLPVKGQPLAAGQPRVTWGQVIVQKGL